MTPEEQETAAVRNMNRDRRQILASLTRASYPTNFVASIDARAKDSPRSQTGAHKSNRISRWHLPNTDRSYGSRSDCIHISITLIAMVMEFDGAPQVDSQTLKLLSGYLGRTIRPTTYRDSLTLEPLRWAQLRTDLEHPRSGVSAYHLGHIDPGLMPCRHVPTNIEWRTSRSNAIQGDQTLREAKAELLKLIGRYFNLGEITITI